jgi:hypothetical protein
VYNVSYKDTIIYLPKTVASVDGVQVSVDTAGKAQLDTIEVKKNKASLKLAIKDGKLFAEGGCDEDSLKLLLEQRDRTIYRLEHSDKKEATVKEVKHVPDVFKYFSAMGLLSLLYLIWRVIKKISPW